MFCDILRVKTEQLNILGRGLQFYSNILIHIQKNSCFKNNRNPSMFAKCPYVKGKDVNLTTTFFAEWGNKFRKPLSY